MPEIDVLKKFVVPSSIGKVIQVSYTLEVHFYHRGLTFMSKVPPAVLSV